MASSLLRGNFAPSGRARGGKGVAEPWRIAQYAHPTRRFRRASAGRTGSLQKHVKKATPRGLLRHGVGVFGGSRRTRCRDRCSSCRVHRSAGEWLHGDWISRSRNHTLRGTGFRGPEITPSRDWISRSRNHTLRGTGIRTCETRYLDLDSRSQILHADPAATHEECGI